MSYTFLPNLIPTLFFCFIESAVFGRHADEHCKKDNYTLDKVNTCVHIIYLNDSNDSPLSGILLKHHVIYL